MPDDALQGNLLFCFVLFFFSNCYYQTNMKIETKHSHVIKVPFTTFLFGVILPNLKYHNGVFNMNTTSKDSVLPFLERSGN